MIYSLLGYFLFIIIFYMLPLLYVAKNLCLLPLFHHHHCSSSLWSQKLPSLLMFSSGQKLLWVGICPSFFFGFVLEYVLTSFVICALCYHQEFFVSRDVLTCGFAHSKLPSGGFFWYVFLWFLLCWRYLKHLLAVAFFTEFFGFLWLCWSYVNMIFWHLHSFTVIKSFFVSRKKS